MSKFLKFWRQYAFLILFAFLILGLLDFRIGMAAIICMVAPIVLSIFRGRYWCGNLCPRGNFYDRVVSKFSSKRKVPRFLKSNYFRILMVIFVFTVFTLGIKNNWGNAYGIGMVFYRIIVVTTLVGVILSLFFNNRTWCYFCPMGSIAAFIAHLRKSKKVLQVSNSCIACKLCEKKCPMAISPYDFKGSCLSHKDCIQCKKCAESCPKKSIGYEKLKPDE
ncbi:MAG: 4Fe-4S binding protein [Bacillota bacterium]|nr:4Fe-4S binding protein [Bacillota bacterium]